MFTIKCTFSYLYTLLNSTHRPNYASILLQSPHDPDHGVYIVPTLWVCFPLGRQGRVRLALGTSENSLRSFGFLFLIWLTICYRTWDFFLSKVQKLCTLIVITCPRVTLLWVSEILEHPSWYAVSLPLSLAVWQLLSNSISHVHSSRWMANIYASFAKLS